jgi:class 3 adenylate cyclase
VERRLAEILAADVVGYSRLIGVDEAGTLTVLRTLLKDLVEPTLKRHRGRVLRPAAVFSDRLRFSRPWPLRSVWAVASAEGIIRRSPS